MIKRGNKSTLQDVATEAGVSCMVASVVLNGARSTTRVSEATRERIVEAGVRLQYRRNAAAFGLSRRKMDTIGVVATFDGGEVNLYVLELLNGVLESAAEYGQNTTVFAIKNWRKEENRLLEFCDGRIDGMILIAPALSAEVAEQLPHHTPLVTINSDGVIPYAHNLDVDNEDGAYKAVKHLLNLGHRRILHISGGSDIAGSIRRTEGYARAHREFGVPIDPTHIVHGTYSEFAGRRMMTDWLARGHTLPTAIFCASDAIATGAMSVLAANGISIPQDISVIGFDDTLIARTTSPPLTTVRQPFREMGRRSVVLVLEQIKSDASPVPDEERSEAPGPASEGVMHTDEFPAELVIRQSAGPPRAA